MAVKRASFRSVFRCRGKSGHLKNVIIIHIILHRATIKPRLGAVGFWANSRARVRALSFNVTTAEGQRGVQIYSLGKEHNRFQSDFKWAGSRCLIVGWHVSGIVEVCAFGAFDPISS